MEQRHLSVSQVKTYLICPLKYFYRYIGSVGKLPAYSKPLNETNLYLYTGNNPVNWIDPLGLDKQKPWWHWWASESTVPGPYGQPMSEWGSNGPTEWGDPLKYTEAAGGGWMWGERAAVGTAVVATGIAMGTPLAHQAFRSGGWLNSNPYLRVGWGRRGGERVFRIAGDWIRRIRESGKIDLWRGGPL